MCGRIFQTHNLQRLIQISRASNTRNSNLHSPNFNTGPTNYIPAVRKHRNNIESIAKNSEEHIAQENENKDWELDFLKWGYDASFSFVINARIEELQDKKMFKNILNSNRCAVIVEGYYEWNEKKEPFVFKPNEKIDHFFIAALYFKDDSIVLLTRPATKALESVHHRMPVLLEGKSLDLWLDCENNSFFSIIDKEILNENNQIWSNVNFYKAGPSVNNIKNKSEKCVMSYENHIKELDSKGIKQYFKPKEISKKSENNEKNKKEEEKTKSENKMEKIDLNEKKSLKSLTPIKRKDNTIEKNQKLDGKSSKTFSKNIREDIDVNNALRNFINN